MIPAGSSPSMAGSCGRAGSSVSAAAVSSPGDQTGTGDTTPVAETSAFGSASVRMWEISRSRYRILIGTKIIPNLTQAKYRSIISTELARYTQRRSPEESPRWLRTRAIWLLRASNSPKVNVEFPYSSPTELWRPSREESKRWTRFIGILHGTGDMGRGILLL